MLFSEINGEYTFEDKGRRFTVVTDPGDSILLIAGCDAGSAASRLEHPGIAGKRREVYEFKHYARGRKWWTSRPGLSLMFLVPKASITLIEEATYSYVGVMIGGHRYTFDVSGGTQGDGWADRVRSTVHISVGHPVRDLRNLAEHSIPRDRLPKGFILPAEDPGTVSRWEGMVQERELWGALKRGDSVVTIDGRVYYFDHRRGRKQHFLASNCAKADGHNGLWRISRKDVNWHMTAEMRGQR
jgi:hypothetical protein